MAEWRHDVHAHPETAFEEVRTSALVAQKLESFGLTVHRGLGRTGVVGTLSAGSGSRAIGLRADMDALHIAEQNSFGHRSQHEGKMHACGHDGHTAMLLGAAKHLSETRNLTARCISFSSRPRKTKAADVKWWSKACSKNSRASRCTACTTGRACRSANLACAPDR